MMFLLVGENAYQRDQKLRELTQNVASVERINGEGVNAGEIIQHLSASSLFSQESTVVIEQLSKNAGAVEKLDDIIKASEHGNDLILVEPSIDKRKSYFKTLKKRGEVVECEPLKQYEAVTFAQQYAQQHNGKMNKTEAETLVNRVGENQYALVNEIDKLLLTSNRLDKQHIETHTEQRAEDSVFALTDALVAGRAPQAIQVYRDLRSNGEEPYKIMGSLAWQLQVLVLISSAEGRTEQEIASQTKLHPFVVKKNLSLTRRLTRSQLKQAIAFAMEADIQLKTTPADNDQLVETLLYRLEHTLH